MAVELIDLINGIFSIIFVLVSTVVGLITISKYFKSKIKTLLWIGLAWILIASPWWPSSLSVLLAMSTGKGLDLATYLLIGNIFVPAFIFFLVAAFTDTYFQGKQTIILIVCAIIGLVVEIYLIYYILVDPSVLGQLNGLVDIEFRGFLRVYLISSIFMVLILGVLIAINSIRADESEIKLRGYFLLFAFISWTIGAICDASIPLTIVTLPLIRILLISSAIEFYIGFVLPESIKKRFIK